MKRLLLVAMLLLMAVPVNLSAQPDGEFAAFWKKFKTAVAKNDSEAVASMTRLPFQIGDRELDSEGFKKQFVKLFNAKVKRCFVSAKPSRDGDLVEVFCGDEIFIFEKVDGEFRFTEIGAND